MYNFCLSKKTGLVITAVLFVLTIAVYGADHQIYGHNDMLTLGLAIVTLLLSLIHYSRPPATRHSHDAETIGWQVMALAVGGLYLARDVFALEHGLVKVCMTWIFVLQLLNYAGCKFGAKKR